MGVGSGVRSTCAPAPLPHRTAGPVVQWPPPPPPKHSELANEMPAERKPEGHNTRCIVLCRVGFLVDNTVKVQPRAQMADCTCN